MTLQKEDITKVFFPNLTGEYYLAFFERHRYKKIVLAKTKKSFNSVIKYLSNDCYKPEKSKVLPAKIKIVNLSEQQKEIASKVYDEKLDSFLLSFIRDRLEDYYSHFKRLPKGFIPTTITEDYPNKISLFNYEKNTYNNCLMTLTKEEYNRNFFESFEKQFEYVKYKNSDYPKTTDIQADIKKLYAVYSSSYDGAIDFIQIKDSTCFLHKPAMFYFEIVEKLSKKDIFGDEYKLMVKDFEKTLKEEKEKYNLIKIAEEKEKLKVKKAELRKLFDK